MKNNFKIASIFILSLSLIIVQCSSENSADDTKISSDNINDSEKSHSIEIDIDTTEYEYSFVAPSPIQIASILQKAEMKYMDGITNEISNNNNYTTVFHQSINFGVYASDIAYCVTNEKYDEAGNYMKVIKDLSNKIGLETIFQSSNLIQRFEDNIGDQDSIMDLLIYIQTNTDDYIQDNELNDLNVIYFTGAWIEGMFLGTQTIVGDVDKKISKLLSEQMTIANTLIKGLEHIEDKNDDITDLTDHIKDVVEEYNNLWSNKQAGENVEYLDVELKHEEVELISSMIVDLRNEIILN
jgi:hypothetical protein